MGNLEIHPVDVASDADIAALAMVQRAIDTTFQPDDPPVPDEEVAAFLRTPSDRAEMLTWLATVDGEPAGVAQFEIEREHNLEIVNTEALDVVPGRRRQGIADAMLRVALPELLDRGRTSLMAWVRTTDESEGRPYAERLGLTERTVERCSRVRLADIDAGLMAGWIEAGPSAAPGYRMIQFEGACPEEHLVAYTQAEAAMVDAPIDDLDYDVVPLTPEQARSREERWRGQGRTPVQTLVLAPDGSGAGLSEIFGRRWRPAVGDQGDTGVVAAHRGRGLGRWMKAANLALARRAIPELEVLETYNAESNPWMLSINEAMGYRPHVGWIGFQGDTEKALAVLEGP